MLVSAPFISYKESMIPLQRIEDAAAALRGRVLETPLIHSPAFSRMFGRDIYLKLENLQKTGSFKIRGAGFKLLTSRSRIGAQGVVAASAGNHAQGVALAARQAGVPATIVMPKWASISKQEATKAYGGGVVLHGETIAESLEKAMEIAEIGSLFVHPFDDPDIIAGQATVGLEIFRQLPEADLVVAPVGGGGLIAGIASALKALRPDIRIAGVESDVCPSASASLREGRILQVASQRSIADGINVKQPGRLTYEIFSRLVEDVSVVPEEQIAAAVLMMLERKKTLAEGSGAAPLAALMHGALSLGDAKKIVLVVSGGNVDSSLLGRILSKGLIRSGRVARLRVQLNDVPGALARLLTLVGDREANVLHIHHERYVRNAPLFLALVELELETRGQEHILEIVAALKKAGYVLEGCDPSPSENHLPPHPGPTGMGGGPS